MDVLDLIVRRARDEYGPRGADLDAKRIAHVIGRLVSAGELDPGEKLPTVRELSRQLHVSASSVSEAWRILRAHAVISTDRRRGTVVRSSRGDVQGRYWNVPVAPGTLTHDLSTGTPDPSLLPHLGPALERLQLETTITSYLDRPVIEKLEDHLRANWPFPPERLTIVDGAQDALDRTIAAHIHLGDPVIVEDPTFPPIIDMLELAGARIIGVRSDAAGIIPESLEEALAENPTAMFVQPRAHNPTGASLTKSRRDELAILLEPTSVIVVEDDHSGSISDTKLHSFGPALPNQVVYIRSFSKSHGPDLRLAAVGGPAQLLDPIINRRHLGPSWTSRLLQGLLYDLLTNPEAQEAVNRAAETYADLRKQFVARLKEQGVSFHPGVGLNVWIEVADEQRSVVSLAAQGIGVAPGRPFMVEPGETDFIRVTISTMGDDLNHIAELIADASV